MEKRVVRLSECRTQEFDWGSITWMHSGATSGSEELTTGEVIIRSGQANPMHTHANCEEALHLLEGELEHSCGDEKPYDLKPGDAICIGRGIPHNARCTSKQDAKMLVVYSSACREMKGE